MRFVALGLLVVAIDLRLETVDFLFDPVGYLIVAGGLHSLDHDHPSLLRSRVLAAVLVLLSIPYIFPFEQMPGTVPFAWNLVVVVLDVVLIWLICGAMAELLVRDQQSLAVAALRRRGYVLAAALCTPIPLIVQLAPVAVVVTALQLTALALVVVLLYRVGGLPGW